MKMEVGGVGGMSETDKYTDLEVIELLGDE